MPTMQKAFIFHCPEVGLDVHVLSAAASPTEREGGISLTCLACGKVHLVVPATGDCVRTVPERAGGISALN